MHPGVHIVSDVRFGSQAFKCGRIQPGDEIVQIDFQTVVGWSTKKLMEVRKSDQFESKNTLGR